MNIDMRASLIPLLAAGLSVASSIVFAAAPIASPDTATTRSGIAVSIPVMANDRDPDGNTFTIGSFPKSGAAKHGTVVRQGANAVYKPAAGFAGTDSFTYRLRDSTNAWSTAARVTVTVVAAPNTPPVARADSVSTTAPDAVTFNLLANDTDANGDTLTVTANSSPANGTVTRSGGMATYTPAAGFSGTNSFNYRVSDGKGGTASATVTITVAPKPNTPPVAGADSASTTSPDAVTLNLVANDSDVDGDSLSITANTAPANGSVTISGGSATYTPVAGFSGTDAFGYTLSDGKGGSATGAVTITVAPKPNTAPVAAADSASTTSPDAVTVNLLTNDTDEDGDTLSVTAHTAPANGTVTRTGGSATYTPAPGFSGTDSFGYSLADGKGGTATGTVTVAVAPKPNTAPVATADSASTTSPNAVTVNLLTNDTDEDGDTLSVTANTAPANGSVTISGGSATYTPAAGFSGSDAFSYTVSDGKGGTSSGSVTLNVEATPAPEFISGSAILNWSVPTTRSNGAPLSMAEIAGYEIYLLAESTGETSVITLDDGSLTSYSIDGLSADTYHFSMAAKDSDGNLSALSAVVSKVIGP
jgi:hypothetical protein